ncbi:hypothetical protein [Paenibacillus sp. UASWS1643]|uniref:hypothetical protein n=1 Tax=Paenibacillus sp. UASWS1643 TaxID=2580422 RepID=UPI0012390F48|nr:hypothetical protein [Paenibacillus sp. UASWS1643]KAA8750103.1 hypothetical protein FE296_16020 [Paenibacillus sp. UASWS1643]
MAYKTTMKIKHDGVQYEKDVDFPTKGVEKADLERLIKAKAIINPDAEKERVKKAEAERLKQLEEGGATED